MTQLIDGHNTDKLPRWARNHIIKLQFDNEFLRREIEAYAGKPSRIETDPYREGTNGGPVYLPDHTIIRFHTDTGEIDVQLRGGRLAVSTGYGAVYVHPQASNTFQVLVNKD